MKKPACASKQNKLLLATFWYVTQLVKLISNTHLVTIWRKPSIILSIQMITPMTIPLKPWPWQLPAALKTLLRLSLVQKYVTAQSPITDFVGLLYQQPWELIPRKLRGAGVTIQSVVSLLEPSCSNTSGFFILFLFFEYACY